MGRFIMNKAITIGAAIMMSLSLAACGSNSTSKKSSTSESTSSVKPSDKASNRTWTYKNNVFDAGVETYKFTKSEVRNSAESGKKVLVLYCDVTNNSKKEQDPSNAYMVIHAYQKTNTSDVKLDPGAGVERNENGDDPLQQLEDNLNNKLLPGKTVHAVMMFTLKNSNPVKVTFENANFDTIGSKTYKIKKFNSQSQTSDSNSQQQFSQSQQQNNTQGQQPSNSQSQTAQSQAGSSSNGDVNIAGHSFHHEDFYGTDILVGNNGEGEAGEWAANDPSVQGNPDVKSQLNSAYDNN